MAAPTDKDILTAVQTYRAALAQYAAAVKRCAAADAVQLQARQDEAEHEQTVRAACSYLITLAAGGG